MESWKITSWNTFLYEIVNKFLSFAVIRKKDVIIKNDLEIKHNDKIEIEFATSKTKAKKI